MLKKEGTNEQNQEHANSEHKGKHKAADTYKNYRKESMRKKEAKGDRQTLENPASVSPSRRRDGQHDEAARFTVPVLSQAPEHDNTA
jgi:hypothetical protein